MKLKKKKITSKKKPSSMAKATLREGVKIPKGWTWGKGRIPGTKNKFTTLKRSFIETFVRLGGVDRMVSWADTDDKALAQFFNMLARMLPREVNIGTVDEVNPANLENLSEKEIDSIVSGIVKLKTSKEKKKK